MACNYAPIYFITACGESIAQHTRLTFCAVAAAICYSAQWTWTCASAWDKTMRANSAPADFRLYLYERRVFAFGSALRFIFRTQPSVMRQIRSRSHWVGKRRRCKRENQLCHCWRHVTDSLIRARCPSFAPAAIPGAFCGGNYARGDRMWRWKSHEPIFQSLGASCELNLTFVYVCAFIVVNAILSLFISYTIWRIAYAHLDQFKGSFVNRSQNFCDFLLCIRTGVYWQICGCSCAFLSKLYH